MTHRPSDGFSLIELLIVVVIVAILAAIAIPNLISSRRAANEASAATSLRTYHGAQLTYNATKGAGNFAGGAGSTVDGQAFAQLADAGLIDEVLGTGIKSGFVFTGAMTPKTDALASTFCGRSVPTESAGPMSTGSRNFALATDGAMMSGPAVAATNAACSLSAEGVLFVTDAAPVD